MKLMNLRSGDGWRPGRVRVAAPGVMAWLMALAQPAEAQRVQVDASGTRVAFDTLSPLNTATLSPAVEVRQRVAYLLLSGGLTAFEGGGWATQGRADASVFATPFGLFSPVRLEALGMAAGTYHSSEFRTAATRAEGRVHASGRQLGAWLGAVGGTGWTSAGTGWTTAWGPTSGAWGRWALTQAAATFSPMRFETTWFPELNGMLAMRAGPVDLAAYAGWRGGDAAAGFADDAWAGANVALWLGRSGALVVSGGSYPSDIVQGLPDGRYLSAGVRLATARPFVPSIKRLGPPAYQREGGRGFVAFAVPGATAVRLVADWTNWQPVSMTRGPDGRWRIQVDLEPGVYRFNLLVDGDEWIVPDGVPSVDDGFGGRTGLLIVP